MDQTNKQIDLNKLYRETTHPFLVDMIRKTQEEELKYDPDWVQHMKKATDIHRKRISNYYQSNDITK